jgi:pyroglutamyl-peptidase
MIPKSGNRFSEEIMLKRKTNMATDRQVRVLLTGFGPFPGAPLNPSRALIEQLIRMRRPAFADLRATSHIFPTRYSAVDRDFPKLIAKHDPDIILMFGLAARTRHIRVETRARNLMAFFPDAGGFVPKTRTIAAGAAHRLLPASLAMLLRRAGRSHGIKCEFSRDAGRYVCNYAFWQALETRAGNAQRLAAFIHIPNIKPAAAKRGRASRPLPSLADLTQTAAAILASLVAAYKRERLG